MADSFSRKDIDHLLFLTAKEYKKQNRHNSDAELILVGGSSVILNYNFRDTTTDIDSIFNATSTLKEIINKVADEHGLSNKWLNDDFKRTESYSPNLFQYSKFYKKFYDCLTVRSISDEYLIAMKIKSSRDYKHDQSDIVGIIKENYEKGMPLSLNLIKKAYQNLYEFPLPQIAEDFLLTIFDTKNLEDLYYSISDMEDENAQALTKANEEYLGEIDNNNIDLFLKHDIKDSVVNEFSDSTRNIQMAIEDNENLPPINIASKSSALKLFSDIMSLDDEDDEWERTRNWGD